MRPRFPSAGCCLLLARLCPGGRLAAQFKPTMAQTGLEYGNRIGDAGFILKLGDGTVTNATWKAKAFFRGPRNADVARPVVEHTPLPANGFAPDFDDNAGETATAYATERVGPALAGFGVGGVLADPTLAVFRGPTQVAANDNWQEQANSPVSRPRRRQGRSPCRRAAGTVPCC